MPRQHAGLLTASTAVARQLGVGAETVRRWALQAQIDGGSRDGMTTKELKQIRQLKAKVRRLEEDNAILKAVAAAVKVGRGRHLPPNQDALPR